MSEPPSWSPDSLTGASAEISALQLVERRGDGGTGRERERERGMDGEKGGRERGVKGREEEKGKGNGDRSRMWERGRGKVKGGRKKMQGTGRRVEIVILAQLSSPYSNPVIHFTSFFPLRLTCHSASCCVFLYPRHPPSSYFNHLSTPITPKSMPLISP